MKMDPYKNKERYLNWKGHTKQSIPDISKENSKIIKLFLNDMEYGINISLESVKGARSYIRLNTLKERLIFFAKRFKEIYDVDYIINIPEPQICRFFAEMRNGMIKRQDGKAYRSVADYVKVFKAFWHWHQRVNNKQGIEIYDITQSLDTSQTKPKWVYLTEEQVKTMCDNAKFDYKVLMMFLLDTGIRAPTELINIKVSDILNDYKELDIKEEISKTFGRRIKLMICSDLLKEYVKKNNLNSNDYLFPIKPDSLNKYLKRLGKRLFGDKISPAGQKYSELTMYDFRHISCCYWLPRYKSESALKFRFGWKKSERIHYYSELLGMRDTISEEDLLIDTTKTELEQRLVKNERRNEILEEEVLTLRDQMKKILMHVKRWEIEVEG